MSVLSGVGIAVPGLSSVSVATRSQEREVVRDGLLAEYRFDEGEGQQLTDYSGNGYHGQLGSSPESDTTDPTWVTEGLRFDGVDDIVDVEALKTPYTSPTDYTLCQVFIPRAANTFRSFGFTDRTSGNTGYFVSIQTDGSGMLMGLFSGGPDEGGGTLSVSSGMSIVSLLNKPVFTALTREIGERLTLHVNRTTFETVDDGTRAYSPGTRFRFGRNFTQNVAHDVCYALFYNRALTDDEIYQNYLAIKQALKKRGVYLP